ncbi:lipoyl(octanoyl) transferase LipB, partial [uncultured Parasutterella sp.]
NSETEDEIWFCEHAPTYTVGTTCPLLSSDLKNIPIVKTDRGGKITYHGPGQIVCYPLVNLRNRKLYPKAYLSIIQQMLLEFCCSYGVDASLVEGAPGIYLPLLGGFGQFANLAKVASIGLKITNDCTYHGFAININADLSPFKDIDPCGYQGLRAVNLSHYAPLITIDEAEEKLTEKIEEYFA